MAEAATQNFTGDDAIEAGATFDVTITLLMPSGDPLDLTDFTSGAGGTLRSHFRPTVDSNTIVFNLTDAPAYPLTHIEVVSPPTAGQLRIVLSDEDTAAADANNTESGVYDVEGERADGSVRRLLEGAWSVVEEVTR